MYHSLSLYISSLHVTFLIFCLKTLIRYTNTTQILHNINYCSLNFPSWKSWLHCPKWNHKQSKKRSILITLQGRYGFEPLLWEVTKGGRGDTCNSNVDGCRNACKWNQGHASHKLHWIGCRNLEFSNCTICICLPNMI
jgi:hypothetical protein